MPLPSSLDYRERYEPLPEGASKYTVSIPAKNDSSFTNGNELIFDFERTGYMIPNSLFIKFQLEVITGASGVNILGTPVYTSFSKLETIIDDISVDTINEYAHVQNMLINLNMNVAEKYSNQFNFSYNFSNIQNIEYLDCIVVSANTTNTYNLAGFIPCLLSNCEKLLPLEFMPKIRMIFTIDQQSNIFRTGTATSYTILNPELVYDCVKLGNDFNKQIIKNNKIFIPSKSFSNQSVFLPLNSNGNRNISFSSYLSNVMCAFVVFCSTVNNTNKKLDAVDITNNSGSYSITIGSVQYPQVEMSALNNKGSVLMELKKCVKSVFGNDGNMSINTVEFNQIDNINNTNNNTPGKFILPFLFKYINERGKQSGISLLNKDVIVNVNQSVLQSVNRFCYLNLVYGAVLEIDLINKNVNVRC